MKTLSTLYLVAVFIVGVAVGYFISKASDSSITFPPRLNQTGKNNAEVSVSGRRIDSLLADSLIKEYIIQNTADVSPLMTDSGPLKGFFISREVFETLFREPGLEGLSIYLAKNPKHRGKTEKIYTLVVMGAKLKAGSMNGSVFQNSEPYFEFLDTCPEKCGNY